MSLRKALTKYGEKEERTVIDNKGERITKKVIRICATRTDQNKEGHYVVRKVVLMD
jgi:hypothetical protein